MVGAASPIAASLQLLRKHSELACCRRPPNPVKALSVTSQPCAFLHFRCGQASSRARLSRWWYAGDVTLFNIFGPASAAQDDSGPTGFLNPPITAAARAQRAALMAAIIAAHLVLALWILLGGSGYAAVRKPQSLTAIDISINVPKPDAPAKKAVVPPVPDKRKVALVPTKVTVEAAPPPASGSGSGSGCSVATAVAAALIADIPAMEELAALPAEVRSDADAVMLWNGSWLDVTPEAQRQLALTPTQPQPLTQPLTQPPTLIPELKRVVTDTVLALPIECQGVETAGPQLIPIPEPGRTTMVVIGSGVWRWSDLIELPVTDPADGQTGDGWFGSFEPSGN